MAYYVFYNEDVGSGLVGVATSVDVDDAWGFALQAGVDVAIGGNWSLNLDVKKIFLDTDVDWALAGGGKIVANDLDIALNEAQRRGHFVGDTGNHLAQRGHLAGVDQLPLEGLKTTELFAKGLVFLVQDPARTTLTDGHQAKSDQ